MQPALTATSPCGILSTPPDYKHVIWIMMENKTYSQVIGNAAAPYISGLAKQCGSASNWSDAGAAYDSLPNYIALATGITDSAVLDGFNCSCTPSATVHTDNDNLFRQVRAKGLKERSYEEGMPSKCAYSGGTQYAFIGNPALYMWGGTDQSACLQDDVIFGSATAGAFINALVNDNLPAFSLVTPNLCNDMHDCSVTAGNDFLAALVPQILKSPAYLSNNTAIFIIWDEESPIPNVVISPSVPRGTVVTTPINHYSALAATEKMLGLPLLLGAQSAPDMRGPFNL